MTSVAYVELGPDTVIGSYRIVREIGRGGMGTVFEAVHTILPRRAAIKVMHPELCRHPGMATRMVQEASILEDIRHPGLVRVFECNLLPDHRPYIVMELVEGDTFASRLQRPTRVPWVDVAAVIANVADVLTAVHTRGIVHRDLKPDNLLLPKDDRDHPIRLIDWGVARLGPIGRLTLEGLTPGTPIYMSPEQATGQHIAAPCDIYSLGVIAYEALAGAPPFDGRTLAEIVCMHLAGSPVPLRTRCSAPMVLCQLVHRMLDKDPSRRPMAIDARNRAREIITDLGTAYDDIQVVRDSAIPEPVPTEESYIVDLEDLECGVTDPLGIPKPRWTPQLRYATVPRVNLITPRGRRDQISGEIVPRRR
jgi:serine/threonine-protein kinase